MQNEIHKPTLPKDVNRIPAEIVLPKYYDFEVCRYPIRFRCARQTLQRKSVRVLISWELSALLIYPCILVKVHKSRGYGLPSQ